MVIKANSFATAISLVKSTSILSLQLDMLNKVDFYISRKLTSRVRKRLQGIDVKQFSETFEQTNFFN
jgi:hypothetical protein